MEKIKEYQVIFSVCLISVVILISSFIFASKIQRNESITVTGSAHKIVKSDSGRLNLRVNSRGANQKEAFAIISTQTPKVIEYLESKGIDKKSIELRPVGGYNHYKTNYNGNTDTNEIVGYTAEQSFEFSSKDVEKIKEISNDIQVLVSKGISLSIDQPEYYYSDLASIKIDLLKDAALDAKQRAKSMLGATGTRVGRVQQMKMGVFQITPPDSTNVADFGYNDTSSIDKKVTAVVNVVFKVK